ncbi:hypothetical protein HU200_027449 [Digitaria exilis]|uniref:Uncharacterized protein n=1 Tax=Digitaria exilis TaxID=1010633 RepID=A0A835BTK8_9POAL|nr:hypothetical protein HU200_027449 [Digitaria exilis]CAB3484697.1 unnamed protein product [Digitaria exilis]
MALDARALREAEAEAAVVPALDDAGTTADRWSSSGNGGASPDEMAAAAAVTTVGVPPVVLWSGDDRRMKQELVAWAKAVASMVVRGSMYC